jgi:hypothetical protein
VYEVTVIVDDNAGGTDTQDLSVTVTDVNEAPVIDSNGGGSTAAIDAAENQTAVTTVTYTDVDLPGDTITYSLSGDDAALFTISPAGVLTFVDAPDFETPTDFDADGVYEVTITVDDNAGGIDTQALSVTVTDVNEAPVIDSNGGGPTAAIDAAENQTAVTTVTYTDVDLPGDTITYSLSGDDASLFTISPTGVLTFLAAPDFETPTDLDGDGVYEVTVIVDDNAGGTDTQDLSVTVTDVNEAPVIDSNGGGPTAAIDAAENQTAVTTVTYTDVDLPGDTITYSLSGDDAGLFTISPTGVLTFVDAPDFEIPTDLDGDGVYDVTVIVDDNAGGTDTQALSVTVTDVNEAPVIDSNGGGSTAAIDAAENQTAVTTVTYTDVDLPGDTITYSLSGDDASLFTISPTGVLTFLAAPDFETPTDLDGDGVYDVTVIVDDNAGGTETQEISVSVTDANDVPTISNQSLPALYRFSPVGTVVGTVQAVDTDVFDSLIYTIIGGNTEGAFSIDATTGELSVANRDAIDFLTHPSFSLTIQVEDTSGAISTALATIDVRPFGIPIGDPALDPNPDPEPERGPAPDPENDSEPESEPEPEPEPEPGSTVRIDLSPPSGNKREVDSETEMARFDFQIPTEELGRKTDLETDRQSDTMVEFKGDDSFQRSVLREQAMWGALDALSHELENDEDRVQAEADETRIRVEQLALGFSTALLALFARASSLTAMALSSLPFWQHADPLSVLALSRRERRARDGEIRRAEDLENERHDGVNLVDAQDR